MGYNDTLQKLEEAAAKTVTDAAIAGLNVYTGHDSDSNVLPKVVCHASNATEFPKFSGNFNVTLNVAIEASADDTTVADYRTLVNTVNDLFMDSAIAATLTSKASNFHAIGVVTEGMDSSTIERNWRTELNLAVYCFAS